MKIVKDCEVIAARTLYAELEAYALDTFTTVTTK